MSTDSSINVVEFLKDRYDLSYQINFSIDLARNIDLRGKRVLEIGGSLPHEYVIRYLGARQWVGLEELSYWETIGAEHDRLKSANIYEMSAVTSPRIFGEYTVLTGSIEHIPNCLDGYFDAIISIAAFEHIIHFPEALAAMYRCLRPGGAVGAIYSPIWSAHNGHHMPTVIDQNGRAFTTEDPGFPLWAHLILRPSQLFEYMLPITDAKAAANIVYNVYHMPHINRLLFSDYLTFFTLSQFHIRTFNSIFPISIFGNIGNDVMKQLSQMYPANNDFCSNGIRVILDKI